MSILDQRYKPPLITEAPTFENRPRMVIGKKNHEIKDKKVIGQGQ